MVIAVDGPGGVGKSTVCRRVAGTLGLAHLDTGSTYRIAALVALRRCVPLDDEERIVAVFDAADVVIEAGTVKLGGEDVTAALRSDDVTAAASIVAALPGVRARVVAWQRGWVDDRGGSAVVEGRDIGTVVFPEAPLKIYLTARPEVRAARRSRDTEAEGKSAERIAAELAERDRRDSTRKASPLRPAADAVVIDTSDLTIDQVVRRIVDLAWERSAG